VGNILIKYNEGLVRVLNRLIEKEMKGTVPDDTLQGLTEKLFRMLSSAVAAGGGPLVGVNGIFSVAHGNSRVPQIIGTIKNTRTALESGFVEKLREGLEKAQATTPAED
jgi:fatty acid/phospholipid biosynthesis enzyme